MFLFNSSVFGGNNMIAYSKHEVIADDISAKVAKDLSEKYQIKPSGFGGMIHEDVKEMALSFDCFREMSSDEYRRLVVACTEYYLEEINSSEELRPYLHNYPFDSNNIDLAIYVFSENRERLNVGQLSCVHVIKGKIGYSFRKTEYSVETRKQENYEEAKQIVFKELREGEGL